MSKVYVIKDWDQVFENSNSRKIKGRMSWYRTTTRQDGLAFRRLLAKPMGFEAYGIFLAVVAMAAKCPRRGVLANEDGPFTLEDIAFNFNASESTFTDAFDLLMDEKIGWIQQEEFESAVIRRDVTTVRRDMPNREEEIRVDQSRADQNKREEEKRKEKDKDKARAHFSSSLSSDEEEANETDEVLDSIRLLYPARKRGGLVTGRTATQAAINSIRDDQGTDTVAWLSDRVKAYSESELGHSNFGFNLTRWMDERCYMQADDEWVRTESGLKAWADV